MSAKCPNDDEHEITIVKHYNVTYARIELFQILLEEKVVFQLMYDGNVTQVVPFCVKPDVNYTALLVTAASQPFIPWFGNVTILYKDTVLLPTSQKPYGPRLIRLYFVLPSSLVPISIKKVLLWIFLGVGVVAVVVLASFIGFRCYKNRNPENNRIKPSNVKRQKDKQYVKQV